MVYNSRNLFELETTLGNSMVDGYEMKVMWLESRICFEIQRQNT
jgi:hypothetical protein